LAFGKLVPEHDSGGSRPWGVRLEGGAKLVRTQGGKEKNMKGPTLSTKKWGGDVVETVTRGKGMAMIKTGGGPHGVTKKTQT